MTLTADELYRLLPAVYRNRDEALDGPLRDLISVIADQARVMELDIARLYDNWFIETCDEWAVPYIGELLGVRGLHAVRGTSAFSNRARVANTLSYRRRKGTATMLEQLARDATGWNARAVEFFELLETTQQFNHRRLRNFRTPDLRRTADLELLDTAFDTIAHTADVRHIDNGRGRHNIPNVGLFLWRLQSYSVTRSTARPVTKPADGRYTFSPLGDDQRLFNRPQTEIDVTDLASEINVPGPLRRRPLYDELEARRQSLVDGLVTWQLGEAALDRLAADGMPPEVRAKLQPMAEQVHATQPAFLAAVELLVTPAEFTEYKTRLLMRAIRLTGTTYFGEQPVLQVFVQMDAAAPFDEVAPELILICDLDGWPRPPNEKFYRPADGSPPKSQPIQLSVDPVLGRIAFPDGVKPNQVLVSYSYGFSGDVGAGPYDRQADIIGYLARTVIWRATVTKESAPVAGKIFATLTEAIDAWNAQTEGSVGVIAVADSRTYEETLTGDHRIRIPDGSFLLIVAADERDDDLDDPNSFKNLRADSVRPHLLGDLSVFGTAPSSSQSPGELVIDGLMIEGDIRVLAAGTGNLGRLTIAHCTLVPGASDVEVSSKNDNLRVFMRRNICGAIELPQSVSALRVEDSLIDRPGGDAVTAPGASVEVESCTVFGGVQARVLDASNCIFTEPVVAERTQVGCVRFCSVPANSVVARRYRCQPDLALENAAAGQQSVTRSRLQPSFTSRQFGHPGYGQLRRDAEVELRTGADDESEMGTFDFLKQPQRESNLKNSLDEFLRFGLEAGLIYVT